jgi:hypothetical protein
MRLTRLLVVSTLAGHCLIALASGQVLADSGSARNLDGADPTSGAHQPFECASSIFPVDNPFEIHNVTFSTATLVRYRGSASGGGTLSDPFLAVYRGAGSFNPASPRTCLPQMTTAAKG